MRCREVLMVAKQVNCEDLSARADRLLGLESQNLTCVA
jgi:hypothetical protein